MASAVIAVVAATLIGFASPAYGKEPKTKRKTNTRQTDSGRKRGDAMLGEVEILGSAEHPQVLFFLPRAKFRLLPLRDDEVGKKIILLDDKGKGENPQSPAR
jgi:hypothetical protein